MEQIIKLIRDVATSKILDNVGIISKHRNSHIGVMSTLIILFILFFSVIVSAGVPSISGEVNEKSISDNTSRINITLITGDIVTAHHVSGKITYSILPAKNGIKRSYQIIEYPEATYVIPNDVDLKKVDIELFNVKYLLKEGYENLSFIPIMVTLDPVSNKKNGISAQGISGLDKSIEISKDYKKIGVAVARLDKKEANKGFPSIMANKEIRKVWLDKKRHMSLSDSVPLIGAPDLWEQGYNGSGIKIAILDTGIDAMHPDLNDMDDNPLTNDPKVIFQKNFVDWTYTDISDDTVADLYGHGTHVASIAAGTGNASGGLYKGVAPGAYLWNLRVLNKYGSGYDSWIIGGINYAAYGPDGIPHTGDEADIISMSLGGGPTDGNDPLSLAVNSAMDAGVVVIVASGNCGNFCISTPGAADKVITVGATDKSDYLAYFSSTGPTLDYRVKPDVVAPGVNIVAARASGTSMGSPLNSYYTSESGTSMATPHVAGAAALLLQKAKDGIPDWILESPHHYNAYPTSYNWEDGITGGTSGGIFGDDVNTSAIDIGFNFTFYGINYSRLYFNTNGLITFDNPRTDYYNVPIPSPAQPNNFIAPFWDDLNVQSGTGNTYYKLDASSNPKKFIITWKDIYKVGNYINPITFQAVLLSNGSFQFQYQDISDIGHFDQTIGSENTDGSEGIQYRYASQVADLSAVMFTPKTSGLGKPNYVKNTLISTAKDLDLSVYEQGGGRIQIPNATTARIIADPATISFKNINGINTRTITFYNTDTTSSRTLNFNVIVSDSSGSIVDAASLSTNSLTIEPNSSASVLLTVDATGIPGSIYSGRITAQADNGEKAGVIFGFANMNELSITKKKLDGSDAAQESVWVFSTENSFSSSGSTDNNGMATILVPDGKYNIWSGGFFEDKWIWTTKDQLTVAGDTSTTLDERLSIPVSFDTNKTNQLFSGLYSVLDYYGYSSTFLSMYPSNTITRITPTSVNIAHSYEYYPAEYYNSTDPSRINTPEWKKLYFFEPGISSSKNYVADYSKLVRRTGIYKTALINESAGRHEWAMNNSYLACICWAWVWQMDLPQQRIEYITPDTYYFGGLSSQNWSLYYNEYGNYPVASTPTESWNGQPFLWSHTLNRGSNWLDLYGNAFIDTGKHRYSSSPVPGNFTLYRNGVKIYNLSTNGYFSYYNSSEPGTANYSAVIEGSSNRNLAVRSRTVLNFSYTGSGDYKPPKISWQIPKLDMSNRLSGNNVEINLSVVDENEYGFVNGTPDNLSGLSLEYSINEGATWNTVTLNSLGNGEYKATISGLLNNAFVSLRTKAIDNTGNSASHELIKAFFINVPKGSGIYTVVSPNGGENWARGTTQMINWTSTVSNKSYIKIELIKPGVANKVIIASTLNDGSHPWLIPVTQVPGTDYKIKITNTTNASHNDTSDNTFTIPDPTITVVDPNGSENWRRGTTQTIRWNSSGNPGTYVKIELLKPGVPNKVIIASTLNDGSHPWLIPAAQAPGNDYKVKITSTINASINDTSDDKFTILAPSFTVVSPDGEENWRRGTTQTIKWNSTESPGTYVKIELLKPGVPNKVIIASTLNDGSHPWLIPASQTPGNDYKVKITSTINASINDTSDDKFTILAPSFTVVSPDGEENWTRGTTQTIKWNSTESPGTYVKIELLKPGVPNKVIIASTLNDGSHPWLIPASQLPGDDYRIKITSNINASVNDTSNNNFSIIPPKITVTSPNGGQTWIRGTTHLITWNYTGNPGTYVKIELLKGGALNRTILASTLNDKSQGWTIPATQAPGEDYKIRITSTTNAAYNDTSDSNFTIALPIT